MTFLKPLFAMITEQKECGTALSLGRVLTVLLFLELAVVWASGNDVPDQAVHTFWGLLLYVTGTKVVKAVKPSAGITYTQS